MREITKAVNVTKLHKEIVVSYPALTAICSSGNEYTFVGIEDDSVLTTIINAHDASTPVEDHAKGHGRHRKSGVWMANLIFAQMDIDEETHGSRAKVKDQEEAFRPVCIWLEFGRFHRAKELADAITVAGNVTQSFKDNIVDKLQDYIDIHFPEAS